MVALHIRPEWTTRTVPNPVPKKNVGTVYVHHEGGPVRGNPTNKAAVLHGIEEMVVAKGYSSIDYNLMVFQDGSLWEGRGWIHEDAATLNQNAVSVSICAVGNFEIEAPTDLLLAGIATGVQLAQLGGWIVPGAQILGHRDSGFSTACPGSKLYAQLPQIRSFAVGGATPPTNGDEDMPNEQLDRIEAMLGNLEKPGALKDIHARVSNIESLLLNLGKVGALRTISLGIDAIKTKVGIQ